MDSGLSPTLPEESITPQYNPNIREMDVGGQSPAPQRQRKKIDTSENTTSGTFDINVMRKQVGADAPAPPSVSQLKKVNTETVPKPATKRKSPSPNTATSKKKSPAKVEETPIKTKKSATTTAETAKKKHTQKKSESAAKKPESKPIQKFTPAAVQNKPITSSKKIKEEIMATEPKVETVVTSNEKGPEVSGGVSQMNLDSGSPETSKVSEPAVASPAPVTSTAPVIADGFNLVGMDEFKTLVGADWGKMISKIEDAIIKKFRNPTQVLSIAGTDIRIFSVVNTSKPDMPAVTIGAGSSVTTVQYVFATQAIRDMTARVKVQGSRLYYKEVPIFGAFLMKAPTEDI